MLAGPVHPVLTTTLDVTTLTGDLSIVDWSHPQRGPLIVLTSDNKYTMTTSIPPARQWYDPQPSLSQPGGINHYVTTGEKGGLCKRSFTCNGASHLTIISISARFYLV